MIFLLNGKVGRLVVAIRFILDTFSAEKATFFTVEKWGRYI